MGVIESEHLLQLRLAHMVAFAALHASPGADAEKGAQQASTSYEQAMALVPYLMENTGSGEDRAKTERTDAVKRYKKLEGGLKALEREADKSVKL